MPSGTPFRNRRAPARILAFACAVALLSAGPAAAGVAEVRRQVALISPAGVSAALEWESDASDVGSHARNWLRTKANSIEGGTSEVMLNVISKRILDLPGA